MSSSLLIEHRMRLSWSDSFCPSPNPEVAILPWGAGIEREASGMFLGAGLTPFTCGCHREQSFPQQKVG